MNFESALDLIAQSTGKGLDLGEGEPSYPDFPLDEYRYRYSRLSVLMESEGLDALILTQEEPIRYLSGYNSVIWAVGRWLPGAFLATRDPADAVLIPSAFDVGAAGGTSWVRNIDGNGSPEDVPVRLAHHLDRLGIDRSRVAVERATGSIMMLPFDAAQKVMNLVPADAADASALVSVLRMQKSPAELARVRTIVRATTAGYRAGLEQVRAGMSEKEVVSIVASKLYASGGTAGTRPLFLNAVAGPDRYPLVDSPASDRELQEGDVLFLDGGAGGDGYMSDIIRLVAVGDIGADAEHFASVALEATKSMVESAVAGTRASEVYQAGQGVFDAADLGQFGGSISGHGIGLEIWERPFIRSHDEPNEDIRLRPGMVLCLEPILVPVSDAGEIAGIFVFEQQICVTDTGNEVLSGDLEARLWRAS